MAFLSLTYNYINNKMGNSHFIIPANLSSEWIEINKLGLKLVHNIITQESFSMSRLIKNEEIDTRSYIQRSIYPIPHTPRIIVIDQSPDNFYFLTQVSSNSLKFQMRKKNLLIEILTILKDLMIVIGQLRQKYGGFHIKQSLIGVTKNEEILAWISQQYQSNTRQWPMKDASNNEQLMIKQLIAICQTYSKFNLSFLVQQFAGVLTFKQFVKHITIKIEVEKFRLSQKNIYVAQMQKELIDLQKQGKKNQTVKGSISELQRTNSNLKNFDRAHNIGFNNTQHRRHNTISDMSPHNHFPKSNHKNQPNNIIISPPKINLNSKEKIKKSCPWLSGSNSVIKKSNSSVKMVGNLQTQFKIEKTNSSETVPLNEMSFCQGKQMFIKRKAWQQQNRITCSSEQQLQDEQRRQSTIFWTEDEDNLCQKSIQQDYRCLFKKSARHTLDKKHSNTSNKPTDDILNKN